MFHFGPARRHVRHRKRSSGRATKLVAVLLCVLPACTGAIGERARLAQVVDTAVRGPILDACDVPGMVVGITVRGKRFFFSYGVASRATGRTVNADTVFEVGSISKVLTATLAAYAAERGLLAFSDTTSSRLPAFAGT
jgi:beta-lactamase class C